MVGKKRKEEKKNDKTQMYREPPENRKGIMRGKDKKTNGLLRRTPKMLSTFHAVLL
jgi:hypothetical protein